MSIRSIHAAAIFASLALIACGKVVSKSPDGGPSQNADGGNQQVADAGNSQLPDSGTFQARDGGTSPDGGSCIELKFNDASDAGNAWFGGDDRSGIGPRNLGGGQLVVPTTDIPMHSFAFKFQAGFTHASNGTAAAVTVRLEMRDANGNTLKQSDVSVPSSFTGGWVSWTMDATLKANTHYIFTAWVVNGYTQGANSDIIANVANQYASGYRFGATGQDDLSAWSLWSGSSTDNWDYFFWIRSAGCPP